MLIIIPLSFSLNCQLYSCLCITLRDDVDTNTNASGAIHVRKVISSAHQTFALNINVPFNGVPFGRQSAFCLRFNYIEDTTHEINQRGGRCIIDLNSAAHSGFSLNCQLQNYGTDGFDLKFMCLRYRVLGAEC